MRRNQNQTGEKKPNKVHRDEGDRGNNYSFENPSEHKKSGVCSKRAPGMFEYIVAWRQLSY